VSDSETSLFASALVRSTHARPARIGLRRWRRMIRAAPRTSNRTVVSRRSASSSPRSHLGHGKGAAGRAPAATAATLSGDWEPAGRHAAYIGPHNVGYRAPGIEVIPSIGQPRVWRQPAPKFLGMLLSRAARVRVPPGALDDKPQHLGELPVEATRANQTLIETLARRRGNACPRPSGEAATLGVTTTARGWVGSQSGAKGSWTYERRGQRLFRV
jgi:hypothetical protein